MFRVLKQPSSREHTYDA